jgi:hypothetical protein
MDESDIENDVKYGKVKSASQASSTLDEKIAKVRHRKFRQVLQVYSMICFNYCQKAFIYVLVL